MHDPRDAPRLRRLLGATAIALVLPAVAAAQGNECTLVNGALPPGCEEPNRDTVVTMPAGENSEPETGAGDLVAEGFVISIDGAAVAGDAGTEALARQADVALEAADIQVSFDGLDIDPRLDLETLGEDRAYDPGDTVGFQSATNYPAFLARGEVRIIDRAARGGPRTVAVVPLGPNGQVTLTLPEGEDLVAVHRVYDDEGRYDETDPLPLNRRDDRAETDGVEEGADTTARRRIPVAGGAITVSGTGLATGAQVSTLGEIVRPDPDGGFVIQRILPAGAYAVDVSVSGGAPLSITREVEIPRTEWFYVGVADLTYGWRREGDDDDTYTNGRLSFYTKGKTARGVTITASADTGEGEVEDLFRNLDEKDPRSLILRIDPDDYYPVYGDDSTLEEGAPTSGRFYLKVEKDGNYLLWGNFRNEVKGAEYLRNERTLYGLQGAWSSAAQTDQGEPVGRVVAYTASPDNLPQRDIFRGTGGSVYFLKRQDISIGSETITVEVRDPDTGRVLDRQSLVYGRDYDINYIQGVVTLTRPLSGSTGGGVVTGADEDVNLVVQYEWTPAALDVDGMSYGARAEVWATDRLRLGVTGMVETTGTADQTAVGADVLWQLSEDTYVKLEYAESDGPGFASSLSTDGGLTINDGAALAGTGAALRFEGRADLRDIGAGIDGYIGAYAERRDEGFSTLDYQTASDEDLWGVYAEIEPSDDLRLTFHYDDFEDDDGKVVREGGAEVEWQSTERLAWTAGVLHEDKVTISETGRRTDVALRATFTESDALEWYVYGQVTADRDGLPRNDRLGFGGTAELGNGWTAEGEISDGSLGIGAKALLAWEKKDNESLYFGYELDPGRELDNLDLVGRDRGRFVFGGKRDISPSVSAFGENTYDLFGQRRSLISAYGVEYEPSDFLTYSVALEVGQVEDPVDGDFDRQAVSFGVDYEDEAGLTARARLEYRRERGETAGTDRDADTIILKATARYEIDDARRLSFNIDAASTETDQSSILDGDLVDASVGYAYRPVDNDRLNLLFKYRWLYDLYGQRINGSDTPGPRQKSHVVSLDADYDLNRHWTIGGKVGVRLSESSPNGNTPFAQNDAWLVVANARYHLVHEWDALIEARMLTLEQAETTEVGVLAAAYKHFGNNLQLGVGYNFGSFSDDLTDLTQDDQGLFVNLVAKF